MRGQFFVEETNKTQRKAFFPGIKISLENSLSVSHVVHVGELLVQDEDGGQGAQTKGGTARCPTAVAW